MVPKHRAAPRHESNRNGTGPRALTIGVGKGRRPGAPAQLQFPQGKPQGRGSARVVRSKQKPRRGLELRLGFLERCGAPVGPDAGLVRADHCDGPRLDAPSGGGCN
jgi:hypothetical protein